MESRYTICLFAVKLFEDHGIKLDRAERLSLSIVNFPFLDVGIPRRTSYGVYITYSFR